MSDQGAYRQSYPSVVYSAARYGRPDLGHGRFLLLRVREAQSPRVHRRSSGEPRACVWGQPGLVIGILRDTPCAPDPRPPLPPPHPESVASTWGGAPSPSGALPRMPRPRPGIMRFPRQSSKVWIGETRRLESARHAMPPLPPSFPRQFLPGLKFQSHGSEMRRQLTRGGGVGGLRASQTRPALRTPHRAR